jgi:hypothetical protein
MESPLSPEQEAFVDQLVRDGRYGLRRSHGGLGRGLLGFPSRSGAPADFRETADLARAARQALGDIGLEPLVFGFTLFQQLERGRRRLSGAAE